MSTPFSTLNPEGPEPVERPLSSFAKATADRSSSAGATADRSSELALDYERPRGSGPKVTQEDVDRLIEALFHAHAWMTADDLGFRTETDKRVLRAIAAASGGHVISWQAGYRLHFEATADESRVALTAWRHMRNELDRRIIDAERVYHRKEVPECLRERVEAARPVA